MWWRLMWTIGALLYTGSLIVTYFLLNRQDSPFVLAWAGFQLTWLAFRILTSYLADPSEHMTDRIMVPHSWEDLEPSMKARILSLTPGVAKYQTHLDHRETRAYGDDSFSPRQVTSLLGDSNNLRISYPLLGTFNPINSSTIEVDITAVISDTALSSASWMVGSTMTGVDLYYSCIVAFSLPLLRQVYQEHTLVLGPLPFRRYVCYWNAPPLKALFMPIRKTGRPCSCLASGKT